MPMNVPSAYPSVLVRMAGTSMLRQPFAAAMPATVEGPVVGWQRSKERCVCGGGRVGMGTTQHNTAQHATPHKRG